jgi:16S rRNA A1518/A1519 N6-dimethyltransferase RsmA/KsgA/DIM1 with predicted DNA glycosylase/AP lyase activity
VLDAEQIAAAGINPQARAETLSVQDFARLSAAIDAD